jgi:hypothetical protein
VDSDDPAADRCTGVACDGLHALQVQEILHRDPLSGHLFCFRGRRGNLLKVIWHDGQGACLFTKRLERGLAGRSRRLQHKKTSPAATASVGAAVGHRTAPQQEPTGPPVQPRERVALLRGEPGSKESTLGRDSKFLSIADHDDWLPVPIEVRPHVGVPLAAGRADKPQLAQTMP